MGGTKESARNQPRIYRILVQGILTPDWSERLCNLRIYPASKHSPEGPATALEGPIADQSELCGVINTLHDLRLTLLGVELMESTGDNNG